MATSVDIKLSVADDNDKRIDLKQRAQWLRAAILGANDGLLSTTALMLGVGAAKDDRRLMIISGVAGALAGACSMAVGEFVSVATQRDIERTTGDDDDDVEKTLPNPCKAAGASGLAFLFGSLFPLLSAMVFSGNKIIKIVAIVVVASVALAVFGGAGARLGGAPARVSALRVVLGGWISMAVTYSLLMPLDRDEGHEAD